MSQYVWESTRLHTAASTANVRFPARRHGIIERHYSPSVAVQYLAVPPQPRAYRGEWRTVAVPALTCPGTACFC
eukprot:781451-Rhodomonas_salina.1